MTKRVFIYPNPSAQDYWSQNCNPQVRVQSEALEECGWEVFGLELKDLAKPQNLSILQKDVLLIHWTENITQHFIKPTTRIFRPFYINGKCVNLNELIPASITFPIILHFVNQWLEQVKKTRSSVFFQVHELWSHGYSVNSLSRRIDDYLKRAIYSLAEAVLTQERSSIQEIFNYYNLKKPLAVTPLGDYSQFHGERCSQNEAKKALYLQNRGKILSYIGTARRNRNPSKAIESFLRVGGPDDLLIIAGQWTGRFSYDIPDPRIKVFSGLIPSLQLRDIFCVSDFVINDAKNYLTSGIVRTAMGFQIPVIAYHYGATIDMAKGAAIFIEDGENALDNALNNALHIDIDTYKRMKQAAKERNAERVWSQYGVEFTKMYDSLITKIN